MVKLSRLFFVGLCFVMVSCSVLSGGGGGATDAEKYAKDLSFPLNDEHLFYLKSHVNHITGTSFFKIGVLLGADLNTMVCLYESGGNDWDTKWSTLLEAWLKRQYSDGTRNFEVTLMRFIFALHNGFGRSRTANILETWQAEYCDNLDVEASKKLVNDEYHVWQKSYQECLHSTCDNVYKKTITTADWAYLIVVFDILIRVGRDFFLFALNDDIGEIISGVERNHFVLGSDGQAFLLFEKWAHADENEVTFKHLLKYLGDVSRGSLKGEIEKGLGLRGK